MGASAKSSSRPGSGLRLPERYEVLRHIATGGMASVWCAEDRVLGRTVAIKVLAERFTHDEFAVLRFQREARAAARVSAHPHVVTIFDVGDIEPSDDEDGGDGASAARAFIVMEHLTGGTVADALRVGEVTRQESMRWLREAASALDHAHGRGIVHRDIKPANFLLDGGRTLHVADFGIARLLSEDTITSSGELFGTAAYLAPEQALGRDATSASDRYALAVAAFELLTGERPFKATHFAAQARQHIEDEPPSASERHGGLPAAVDPVLVRGMAKKPEDRYETAGGFVEALEAALDGTATAVTQRLAHRRRPMPVPVVGTSPARAAATRALAGSRNPTIPPRRAAVAPRARPVPASSRTGGFSSVPPASSGPERHRGRVLALTALAVAALGVVLLGLLGNSGAPSHSALRASTGPSLKHAARTRHRAKPAPTRTTSTAASSSATTSASATASSTTPAATGTSAADLQSQGHQLMLNGAYPAAITALRQAASTASPSSLTYAYALYDLGRSLLLSGDPQAAIPVLQQRLKIPNQTGVVQQALNQALQAAGQSSPSSQTPTGSQSAPATGGTAPASPPSGGAGIGHGRGHGDGNGNGNGQGGA